MKEVLRPVDGMEESLQAAIQHVFEDNDHIDKLAGIEELRQYATQNAVTDVEFVNLFGDLIIEDLHNSKGEL
jgi:hypothetical protein